MTLKHLSVLIIAAFFMPLTSHAQGYESHQQIVTTATELIETLMPDINDKKISIQALDNRLLLNKCNRPLAAFLPNGSQLIGKTTIGVRCTGTKPWKVYVSANIAVYSDVIIANEFIVRGTQIRAGQIKTVKKEISEISRGYFSKNAQVVGKIAKYTLNKNAVIHTNSIARPKLVKRGKDVVIIADSGGITVRMRGTAMSDGALGDHIKIKNKRSRRIIQAEVIDSNLVRVKM